MRPPTIDDDRLLDCLTELFRVHGYIGATLSRVSEATGLRRASLYHRFPGGKDEMAEAVLAAVDRCFSEELLAPLGEDGDPAARVRAVATRLRRFYLGGRCSCVLDTLSLGEPGSPIRAHVERSLSAWIDAFAAVAREAGRTPAAARRDAEDAVVRIQGALMVARCSGNARPFGRVMRDLPDLLTGT